MHEERDILLYIHNSCSLHCPFHLLDAGNFLFRISLFEEFPLIIL